MAPTAPGTSGTPGRSRPLPQAVYWRRRLFVVGVVVALGLIAVNSIRGVSEPDADVRATTASADQNDDADSPTPGEGPSAGTGTKGKKRKGGQGATTVDPGPTVVLPTAPVLVEPEGTCTADDIVVTPTIQNAVAGQSATIVLGLRTNNAAACTWEISSETLAVRISVGDDEVWASRECTDALPERSVVVRQAVTSTYRLSWNTRRSDTGCPAFTSYAEPGDYRVAAAALGGEAADLVFDLAAPTAPEPPAAPVPDRSQDGSPDGSQDRSQNGSPDRSQNGPPDRSQDGSPDGAEQEQQNDNAR